MLEQVQGVPRVLICLAHQVSSTLPCHWWDGPGSPSSPEALLVRSPLHDLVMGRISHAGSQHPTKIKIHRLLSLILK